MDDTRTIEFKEEKGYLHSFYLAEAIIEYYVKKYDDAVEICALIDELAEHLTAFSKAQNRIIEERNGR